VKRNRTTKRTVSTLLCIEQTKKKRMLGSRRVKIKEQEKHIENMWIRKKRKEKEHRATPFFNRWQAGG
jgi:hypothetical protein